MRRLLPVAAAVAASLLSPLAHASAADDATPAVAWTVETVDGVHGTDRANFSYVADPGGSYTDVMRVTNTGTTPLDLAVYAADAFTTPTGNIDLHTSETPSVDAGTWVEVDMPQLSLAPGAQADVGFTVTVPADAAPGDHSAGLITSFRGGGTATVDVDRRLATRITVRVSGELAPAVEVTDVAASYRASWNPFEPGAVVLAYRVTNAGNTLVTGVDASAAAGPFGAFGTTDEPALLPEIIPGSTIEVERELPMAPWGWVSGSVVVEPEAIGIGARGLASVVHDYTLLAVPWTLLLALLLVAATVVTLVALARRRTRAAPPLVD
ncbi:WxL protein peptidoglycan domain-containing protein [Microbacterium sp. SLBN-146]|uniref:WxL protein peptidoglycan domain-containing protein n=1 Tax=Microbacterium sp. SLBN-146 TaxID=2768457 RepID=UPI00117452D3|nr:DUF916 domain-containing protein [Microbacterium sp. SLBN-146]TQJ30511.1 uncharacterized protein DUF916 [Microbacterium sp. SLBN-146]